MQPFVELFPASHSPIPPAGTSPGWASGPDTFDRREQVPVLIWGEHRYWAFDYIDNRNAFIIAAYDRSGNLVKQWEKQGPRYIWDFTFDQAKKTLTFFGQSNEKLDVKLDELYVSDDQYYSLYPPPVVSMVPVAAAPALPAGLYSRWQLQSNMEALKTGIPVLAWQNYTYRVYEHPDNRLAFAIIAFNKDGRIVKDWEVRGVRYITDIAVDLPNKRINFTGQGPKTVTYTWDDLKVVEQDEKIAKPDVNNAPSFKKYADMEVKEVTAKTAPAIPDDLEMERAWTAGPNSHADSKNCSVLIYQGYTYWAFDNKYNEYSIGIAAYDSDGKLVKHLKKPGTRYIWSVSVDPMRKTVTYWGQANTNVVVSWDELTV